MTSEQIEKFFADNKIKNAVRINFKTRNTMLGIFVSTGKDYEDLKSKNFWRIITESNIENWKKTHDMNLIRIFNGAEITKLTMV